MGGCGVVMGWVWVVSVWVCGRWEGHPPNPPPPVPDEFIRRHPFPGPGLAVRALGDVTDGTKLNVLRRADEIFVNCIREYGLYDEIWQAFAGFLPIKTVGVQGDQRTHSYVIGLR